MDDSPHILVVDDDREIRMLLRDYLEKNGFRATTVADGLETRRALESSRFDLIVLDLLLPGESGLEICREIRSRSAISVIMLTALGDEIDRVVGLEMGADDYVAKPFSPRELVGRIRAVLRRTLANSRTSPVSVRCYRFDGWRLDCNTRALVDPRGAATTLNGAEFGLLSLLLARAPALVPRSELMSLLRRRAHDPFDRSIDVRVSRLRQLLGHDGRATRIIRTVYGEGYVIAVAVEREE